MKRYSHFVVALTVVAGIIVWRTVSYPLIDNPWGNISYELFTYALSAFAALFLLAVMSALAKKTLGHSSNFLVLLILIVAIGVGASMKVAIDKRMQQEHPGNLAPTK